MKGRRKFMGALGALALAPASMAAAQPRALSAADGLATLQAALDRGRQLRDGDFTPLRWQDEVMRILAGSDLDALATAVDLPRMLRGVQRPSRGARVVRIPGFSRLDSAEGADVKLFFFGPGRVDPPHVHFNLVAAHLVLQGQFRVRHFERVHEESDGFVIRPTRTRRIGPGEVTSISDVRENGHSHEAITAGVLLDVQQGRIDPTRPVRRRELLDVARAQPRDDGTWLARRITQTEALRRFG